MLANLRVKLPWQMSLMSASSYRQQGMAAQGYWKNRAITYASRESSCEQSFACYYRLYSAAELSGLRSRESTRLFKDYYYSSGFDSCSAERGRDSDWFVKSALATVYRK